MKKIRTQRKQEKREKIRRESKQDKRAKKRRERKQEKKRKERANNNNGVVRTDLLMVQSFFKSKAKCVNNRNVNKEIMFFTS